MKRKPFEYEALRNDPKYDRLAREILELLGRLRMRRFGEGWPLMTRDQA